MENSKAGLLSQLQQLRNDPILRLYLDKGHTISNDTTSPKASSSLALVEDATQEEKPMNESVLYFQEKWRAEDDHRIQLSLRAQKAFLEAQQSIAAFREGNSGRLFHTPPRRMSEPPPYGAFSENYPETASIPVNRIKDEMSSMQEKLAHRERTIERLQHELQLTRSHYETEIAHMHEAYERLRHDSAMEISDLKGHLTHFALSSGVATSDGDHCMATDAYIEAVEFKEKMLEEMHSAFAQASQDWKRSTMQTVSGMQSAVTEEMEIIAARAEDMSRRLETALHSLYEHQARLNNAGMKSSVSSVEDIGRKLVYEEAKLMESQEERLRDHVHTVVRDAVHSRLKEILRPIVKDELSKSFKLQENAGKAQGTFPVIPFNKSSSMLPKDDSSPAKERFVDVFALFQRFAQRSTTRGESVVSNGASATALLDEVDGTRSTKIDTVQCSMTPKESFTGRPPWLDRYCH